MRKKWSWFPYDATDYKAAQGWLDRQAARGWALKHIYFGCLARLEEAEAPRHLADVNVVGDTLDHRNQEYLQLCDDAGWELVQNLRGMFLFRAKPGADPAPVQTDDGIEWERFWKKYVLRGNLVGVTVIAVAFALIRLFYTLGGRKSIAMLPASNGMLLLGAVLALMVVSLLWSAGHTAVYYFQCRRAGRIVTPGRRSTAVRADLTSLLLPLLLAGHLVVLLESFGVLGVSAELRTDEFHSENTATVEACRPYPVVMGDDLGLDSETALSRYLNVHRSVLMAYLDYSELIPDGPGGLAILSGERYECVSEPLARWVLGQRKRETEEGAFLWGELPWEAAGLPGFDESYVCRDNGYLLLREGKTVALVGCSQGADLTSAAVQDMLWERLGLN